LYRPNFCADCGERVVRARWRAWSSRRFCPACERRHGRAWPRPLAALCLFTCAGFAAGRLMRPAPPPLVIERGSLPTPALLARPAGAHTQTTGDPGGDAARDRPAAAQSADSRAAGGGPLAEPPTDPSETVSVCGARTKKGTPCSRRVRGTGRCWQHRGRPAMLPAAKLVVRD
jgi:hypothetical protein